MSDLSKSLLNQVSEQQNAAQGSEKEIIMSDQNSAAEEVKAVNSEAGAEPTTVAQDLSSISYAGSMTSCMKERGVKVNTIVSADYRELVEKGAGFTFLYGNRTIDCGHVQALLRDIKNSETHRFSKHAVAVPLKPVLTASLSLPEEQRPKAFDQHENEITFSSPNVDFSFLIIDGQHRIFGCIIDPTANVDVDILEVGEDIITFVKKYNNLQKNWSCDDWRHERRTSGRSDCIFYEKSDAIRAELGCTPKFADYLLSFVKDVCRVSDVKNGKDPDVSAENIRRGEELAKAIDYRFSKCGADDIRCSRKVEFVDCIKYTYNRIGDASHPTFARNMSCFIANMPEKDAQSVLSAIRNKDFGQANTEMLSSYYRFVEYPTKNLDDLKVEVDIAIKEYKEEKERKDAEAKPVIGKGTPKELLDKISEKYAYEMRLEKMKAIEKAEKEREKEEKRVLKEKAKQEEKVRKAAEKAAKMVQS